jgi:SAM-dependent methyltransferase
MRYKLLRKPASFILDILPERWQAKMMLRDAAWYDDIFRRSVEYNSLLWKSSNLILYSAVAARILPNEYVIEYGCGTGAFAELCQLRGLRYFMGLDFSEVAVEKAKVRLKDVECPDNFYPVFYQHDLEGEFNFWNSPSISPVNTVVVAIEVLEHLKEDLRVVARIPKGTSFVASVPTFWSLGHARRFKTMLDVRKRYEKLLEFQFMQHIDNYIIFRGRRK